MIRMTNGTETMFVFDCFVGYYEGLGYAPVTEEPAAAIVVNDVPAEPEEEAAPTPEVTEANAPVTEEPAAPADYEPNAKGRYECPYCDKDYSTKANLLKHISQAHPEVE